MRTSAAILTCCLPALLSAQVVLDKPVMLSGAEPERRITGAAAPLSEQAAITVGHAVLGSGQWAQASTSGDTIMLATDPPVSTINDGLLLRFAAPATMQGALHLRPAGHAALPLRRPDGLRPFPGQVRAGAVCEVVRQGDTYVLLAPAARACPAGWLPVHDGLCIEQQDFSGLNFHQAAQRCTQRGGRLCTWDEYHVACTLLQDQLIGLFDGWEWIDDTSNHTQTGDQVGDTDCFAQRSASPLNPFQVRCCMHPR